MPVTSYSRTPASNSSAPPNGWPEGQSPGSVNNVGRQMMTDIVNEASKGAAKVLGTVAGTNTITAVMSPALDAYSAGMMVVLTPANTNTGAVTIAIDSLTALDVQKGSAAALVAGDLVVGVPALLLLDSGADDFVLLNPQTDATSGVYTPILTNTTNVASSIAFSIPWMRVGSVVTVGGAVSVTCTSGLGIATELRISLPVTSNLTSNTDLGGAGAHNSSPVSVIGNNGSDVAAATWFSSTASSASLTFSFSYVVK